MGVVVWSLLLVAWLPLAPAAFARGRRDEDDDFGFLVPPNIAILPVVQEYVDVDESVLQQEINTDTRHVISGNSLRDRLQRLVAQAQQERRDQQQRQLERDHRATRADAIARENPPPLATRVPKILHQTWKSYQVQSVFQNFTSSWRRVYPDWEYWFWTDRDVQALVNISFPRYRSWYESFDGYAPWIQKADTWKYLALYAFGGVYADLDVEAIKPFDDSLLAVPLLLSTEPNEHSWILNHQSMTVCNAFMSSVPAHPFWIHVLKHISRLTHLSDPVDTTGPRMLQAVLNQYHTLKAASSRDDPHFSRRFPEVVTAAPELYMPFFDVAPVKQKCDTAYLPSLGFLYADELDNKIDALCSKLRAVDFQNTLPASSFTAHHWAHTWLGQVQDKVVFDISPQMAVGKAKAKSLPPFEEEEVWVEKMLLWDEATRVVSSKQLHA